MSSGHDTTNPLMTTHAQQRPLVAPIPFVSDSGAVTVPSFALPFSSFASAEARAAFTRRVRTPAQPMPTDVGVPDLAAMRQMANDGLRPALAAYAARHPFTVAKEQIGDVPVEIFVPAAGIAPENEDRVLIAIHGGGFDKGGGGVAGAVEAVPIAGIGRIKVVAVDYRLLPEHTLQDAVDDVMTVYRRVLQTHEPENIGVYGCSAGGALTGWAVAACLRQDLPVPGAVGIFCASLHGFIGGDSAQLWPRLGSVVRLLSPPDCRVPPNPLDPTDGELKEFPAALFLTGTRAFDMSGAVQSHLVLHGLGVETHLLLFDGLDHGFFVFESGLPETRRAHECIARFFVEHLGSKRTAGM